MATYRLDDPRFPNLEFDPSLWKGIDTSDPSNILTDPYPTVTRLTSLSENEDYCWIFGRAVAEGNGKIEVLYPYHQEPEKKVTLKNVSLSDFPYIYLKAITGVGSVFKGWYSSPGDKLLSREDFLIIGPELDDITGFKALFKKDESGLGI